MKKTRNKWSATVAGVCDPGTRPASQRPATARRGVLLLVVLSLLVLFSLIAVTFVLVAGRYLDAAKNSLKVEQTGDDPAQLLDEVLAQCVRGTTNPHSVLLGHSLLEDLYGNDGIAYNNPAGTPGAIAAGPGVLDLTFTPGAPPTAPTNPNAATIDFAAFPGVPVWDAPILGYPLSANQLNTPGYFNGCVLTAIGGAADGKSTRILGWSYDGAASYTIRVAAFDGVTLTAATAPTGFVINGRPFNGTGFGLNTQADPTDTNIITRHLTLLDATNAGGVQRALLANPVFFVRDVNYPQFGGIGGADEDYDAPDSQNMLLGHVSANASNGGNEPAVIPSLHRPETIAFLNPTSPNDREAQLRPLATDHPQFPTLVDADADKVPDAYDIDNDSDGIAESIWVDAGLPVRTSADGRMYKPMVAILCLDLDGRLNVNAHGNLAQASANYATAIAPGAVGSETISNFLFSPTGTGTTVTLPRGQGYGPAEINLAGLFGNSATLYKRLLQGGIIGSVRYEGRYGESAYTTGVYFGPLPGVSGTAGGPDDMLARIKRFGIPFNYYNPAVASGYGSPPDLWGRSAMGLDYAGQPIYTFAMEGTLIPGAPASPTNRPHDDKPNDPYAVNLTRARAVQNTPTINDNLFSVAELEHVLRNYDADAAGLPDRLRALLNLTGTSTTDLAKLVTTDSNDLPVPAAGNGRDFAAVMKTQNGINAIPGSTGFLDLVRAKLIASGGFTLATAANGVGDLITKRVLAPEMVEGKRFDVNRPFGNGEDDDADGTVDEPDEYSSKKEVPTSWAGITGFTPPTFMDLNRDGVEEIPVNPDDPTESDKARQAYAQQLYFLMMLLSDQSYMWAQDSSPVSATTQRELTARQIAQWAINVVDFRDADSIMTPFEYDVNPFNGWAVDGIVGSPSTDDNDPMNSDRRVVWGVEYPELLLTETLATHNRRVQDKDDDLISNNDRNDSKMNGSPDPTLDQSHVPQGSVFFELYSPRVQNPSQKYPSELYTGGKLDLGKMAPAAGAIPPYPVWRIAVTESRAKPAANLGLRVSTPEHPDTSSFDPIAPGSDRGNLSIFNPANAFGGEVLIDRIVWFSSQVPTGTDLEAKTYFNRGGAAPMLDPGRFALVGPRPVTYFGNQADGVTPSNQRIDLNTGTVEIYNSAGTATYSTAGVTPPLPIICSSGSRPLGWTSAMLPAGHNVGVSVTEPIFSGGYYPAPTGANQQYSLARDIPLDSSMATAPLNQDKAAGLTTILQTGTTPAYKHALLQRLADPTKAYNPASNPYITVDWQPIDLLVFNGEKRNSPTPSPFDPDDPTWGDTPPLSLAFAHRSRGTGTPTDANPWTITPPEAAVYTPFSAPSTGTDVFPYSLHQSLGSLNPEIGNRWAAPTSPAYANLPDPAVATKPYPSVAWNNRPFVSEAELLLVPSGSAEQMLRQLTAPIAPGSGVASAYQPSPSAYHLPFKHLLNFRLSGTGIASSGSNYSRILDYLQVPTPFVNTETYLNLSAPLTAMNGSSSLLAPFNRVSHYREPGRININTIPGSASSVDSTVWNGVLNTIPGGPVVGPTWNEVVASRRGDTAVGSNVTNPTTLSSYFARPFRSAAGAAYALPGTLTTAVPEVEATLLRQAVGQAGRGLFENRSATIQPFADPIRNASFHFEPMQRLSNLLTTRSNVYAIWLTVGYFEVRPGITSAADAYPDGYELMQEIGSDTGEIVRHRAFYIYDRSIPVGFEPGKDHNFADGLLLKRFIE